MTKVYGISCGIICLMSRRSFLQLSYKKSKKELSLVQQKQMYSGCFLNTNVQCILSLFHYSPSRRQSTSLCKKNLANILIWIPRPPLYKILLHFFELKPISPI